MKVHDDIFKVTTVDETDLSTSERSIESSPALQRWVGRSSSLSPVGTTETPEILHSFVPTGLYPKRARSPSAEALGYFQVLLQSTFT